MTPHTISRELAERLHALGVRKESYFEWRRFDWGWNVGKTQSMVGELEFFPAYTSDEIGAVLPWSIGGRVLFVAKSSDGSFSAFFQENSLGFPVDMGVFIEDQGGETLAEAMGLMLAYLITKGLVDVTKV